MGVLSLIKSAPRAVIRCGGKVLFALKKTKPQIMVGGGIVIAAGAFVLAIMNSRKLDGELAISEAKVDELEQKKTDIENCVNLSEEEKKQQLKDVAREINKAKTESIWKVFKLIGVPSVMFAGGIAMTVGGHVILVRRFGQLSASLAALKESYDRYRQNVIAEHGEEADKRYRLGIVDTVEGKATVTDENGNTKEVKTELPVVDPEKNSNLYSFIFSEEFSRKCPRDPVNTISFLRAQERYWNIWMQATGKPVTLSMILDDLGIEMDPNDPMNDYILIAGWRPNGDGDNAIDFGIMRAVNKRTLNMEENVVMLNFNCDGNLYHSARYDKDGRKVC